LWHNQLQAIVKQIALPVKPHNHFIYPVNHTPKMQLFTSTDLARMAREERLKRGLTQDQVARFVSKRADTPSCTKQAISQAENQDSGSKMDGLRIKIVESLTGRKLVGPLWHFDKE
jgi:hypothetical protein